LQVQADKPRGHCYQQGHVYYIIKKPPEPKSHRTLGVLNVKLLRRTNTTSNTTSHTYQRFAMYILAYPVSHTCFQNIKGRVAACGQKYGQFSDNSDHKPEWLRRWHIAKETSLTAVLGHTSTCDRTACDCRTCRQGPNCPLFLSRLQLILRIFS